MCNSTVNNIGDLLCKFGELLGYILPLLVAIGVIIFVWGVIQYVISDDEEAKTKGKDRMIWGIIGFVVIVSLWGLVSIVVNTFGLDAGTGVTQTFLEETGSIGGAGICEDFPSQPKLHNFINYGTCLITNSIIPLIFSLAVLMFIWGVVQYVISGANEEQKDKGKQYMIWGIIALTVMVSVWGIVRIIGTTFGIEYAIPQVRDR